MAINNITRTNTIDEWRIQTNLAANALNQIETGNYNKTNGTFTISSNGALSITAQGTPLQVSNNALIGTQLTVGKDIVLGSEVSQTGNLSVGNTVFIYGGGGAGGATHTGLYIANNVISNGSLVIKNTIVANNLTVNSNVVVVGTANTRFLGVANSGYIGTTLTVIGNTAVGNLTTANSVVADNGRFSNNVTVEHIIAANSVVSYGARITNNTTTGNLNSTWSVVADNARITANATATEITVTTLNATNARISANANAAHFTAGVGGSVVADNARFATNVAFGSSLQSYANGTSFVANGGSVVVDNTRINANASVGGHIVVTNSVVSDTARFATNVAFGSSLQSYANGTSFVANGGSVVANNARFIANTSIGQELTTITVNTVNSRVSGNSNAAHFTANNGGSVVADTARFNANTSVGEELTTITVNTTNARIGANANAVHFTASQSVVADTGRFATNVAFGSSLQSYANGTSFVANGGSVVVDNARINANASVGGHIVTTNSVVADTGRFATNVAFGSSLQSYANGNSFVSPGGSVVVDSLRITSATAAANISGNLVTGNVNTQGMVYAGSLVSGKTDVGALKATSFETIGSGDALITGKLTVNGDFVLSGDIVYDTDALAISTVTPIINTGAGYFGVFRGNDKGGVNGGTGGSAANANAYIRWSGDANTWQIRDVFNSDPTNQYSKILTANLITTSTASVSNADFASSWLMKNYVDNANTNLKSYVDTSAIQTAAANAGLLGINLSANIGAARIADTANTGLGDIIVMGRANGAFGIANLASNTFNGTSGSALPSNGVVSFTSTNGITLVAAANTITVNTPQDVRTTASPTFNALTLTNALPTSQGGTGATSPGGALTNLLPAGGTAGYVLATSGSGTYYWAAGGTGSGGGSTPGTTITSTRTTPTVNASQRIFVTPIYQTGTGQLRVYINGVRQFASEYTEGANNLTAVASVASNGYFSTTSATSTLVQDAAVAITGTLTGTATISGYVAGKIYYIKTINVNYFSLSETVGGAAITTTAGTTTGLSFTTGHSVTLTTGTSSGDAILLEVDAYTVNPYYANNIAYGPVTGDIAASANTIQLAIDSLESRKITTTAAQANVGAGLITVTNGYQANVGAGRITDTNTFNANTGALSIGLTNEISGRQANVGAALISATNGYQANTGAVNIGLSNEITNRQANVGAGLITVTTAYQANSGAGLLSLSSTLTSGYQANSGAGLLSLSSTLTSGYQANSGAALISATNGYQANTGAVNIGLSNEITNRQANVGAARIADVAAGQANVGAGLITVTNGYQANTGAVNIGLSNEITNRQANTGAALITALNASNISSGTLPSARISGSYTGITGVGTLTAGVWNATSISTSYTDAKVTSVASKTGDVSLAQADISGLTTGSSPTFSGLTINGSITATGDITAGFSDDKLKTRLGNIENALDKVSAISGFFYEPNKTAQDLGFEVKREVGVSAQEVQAIMPEVVVPAPIDNQYLTVHYEKLIPLLIEAIKELRAEVEEIKGQIK